MAKDGATQRVPGPLRDGVLRPLRDGALRPLRDGALRPLRDRSLVRASDIGLWSFCQRSWWLAQVKGAPHHQPAVLQRGQTAHAAHGRAVIRAQRGAHWARLLGLGMVALAILLAALMLLLWFIQS